MSKEVLFGVWCAKCTHSALKEDEDPCDECLNCGSEEDSTKPLYFKDKE